eukprot:jgi/Mesen1/7019/ME000365S06151
MSSNLTRRRVRHGDLDGGTTVESDGTLGEPLLGGDDDDDGDSPHQDSQVERYRDRADEPDNSKVSRHRERVVWHRIFSELVSQWVAWFGHVVRGAGAMLGSIGGSMTSMLVAQAGRSYKLELPPLELTAAEEEHLTALHRRLTVAFDGSLQDHQLDAMVSEQGGGYISLENLLHFAYRYPRSFQRLLNKEEGRRAEWEYPFAVAGLNLTFMLIQLLDLRSPIPKSLAGRHFVKMLGENEKAFDELYCVAFEMLDAQWLAMRASYMEFNVVMQAVRSQLDGLLRLETTEHLSDLPAFRSLS